MNLYINPGQLFVERNGLPESIDDIFSYTDFLYLESGVSYEPPIDISAIYKHFGIIGPIKKSFSEQGGISDPLNGKVWINNEDSQTRQRFSEAHELMEFLFSVDENIMKIMNLSHKDKERICDMGAARIIMPISSFTRYLTQMDVCIETGLYLSRIYNSSLMSTFIHMVSNLNEPHIVVFWRYMNKPSDKYNQEKRIRVEYCCYPYKHNKLFIPRYRSINESSKLYLFLNGHLENTWEEEINIHNIIGKCKINASKLIFNGEEILVTLINCKYVNLA